MPRRVKSDIHMQTTIVEFNTGPLSEGGPCSTYEEHQLLTIPVLLQNAHSRGEEIWNSHLRMKLRLQQHRLDQWRRGRDRWSWLEDLEDADRVNKRGKMPLC